MKKFFTILFVAGFITAGAQEIADSSKIWSNLNGYCHPDYTLYTTEFFRFDGDTVFDTNSYKLVYISEDEFHEEWFFFGAYVREENGKVFYRDYSGEEGLIYDFTLETGDTVTINNPRAPSPVTLTLAETDSVETPDGYRERWKLTSEDYEIPEYWIRGVGSTGGVINSTNNMFGGMCGSSILLCAHQEETLIYQNPDYDSCYYDELIVGEEEITTTGQISNIRYVSSDKSIELTFSSHQKHTIIVTDIQGRLINKMEVTNDHAKISLPNHERGLYVITIMTSESPSASRKVMVY